MKGVVLGLGRFILHIAALRLDIIQRDVSRKDVETWFKQYKTFFILSIGRSGSLFLADLLSGDRNFTVIHEPNRLDFIAYLRAFHNQDSALNYVSRFRKQLIFHLAQKNDGKSYGEVNSILRRHASAISEIIPDVKLIHLVRDGRDVVRSMMARRTFTHRDPVTMFISPNNQNRFSKKWNKLDRFEKLCWYWMIENKYLLENIDHVVRFEDIISEYSYFSDHILDPLGLDISDARWHSKVNQPKNVTKHHVIPHWNEWDRHLTQKFRSICGGIMERLGYQL